MLRGNFEKKIHYLGKTIIQKTSRPRPKPDSSPPYLSMTRLSAPWRSTTNTPSSSLMLSVALLSTAVSNVSGYAICLRSRTWTSPKLTSVIGGRRGGTVRCMANQRRVKMVAKQIQRELSDMLITDKVLQYAVLPEASLGADRYLSSLTTISGVEVSSDLQVIHLV